MNTDSTVAIAFAVAAATIYAGGLAFRPRGLGGLTLKALLFALVTGMLIAMGVEPYRPAPKADIAVNHLLIGLAKAAWWVVGASLMVSLVRLFLILERKPHEGRFLQDLLAGLIYIGAFLSVVAYAFGVPVGTLIATSGIIAVILGLALQSTLSDVFSGIALNVGRAYGIGDWIVLDDDIQGRVVESNWRATHLLNGANDLVVIPNSVLAKARLVNLSSPDETHGISVVARFVPDRTPAVIEDVLQTVLLAAKAILHTPTPSVTMLSLSADVIEFELSARVRDISRVTTARNELYDLIFRHSRAAGIRLATTLAASQTLTISEPRNPNDAAWDTVSLFETLTDEEKEHLLAGMQKHVYPKDAVILEQGARSDALMIVRHGVITVTCQADNRAIELNRLSPGDWFGERGVLMGQGEPGIIRAVTPSIIYAIDREKLATILKERPLIADELGALLAERLEAERAIDVGNMVSDRPTGSLGARIRNLFQLERR